MRFGLLWCNSIRHSAAVGNRRKDDFHKDAVIILNSDASAIVEQARVETFRMGPRARQQRAAADPAEPSHIPQLRVAVGPTQRRWWIAWRGSRWQRTPLIDSR